MSSTLHQQIAWICLSEHMLLIHGWLFVKCLTSDTLAKEWPNNHLYSFICLPSPFVAHAVQSRTMRNFLSREIHAFIVILGAAQLWHINYQKKTKYQMILSMTTSNLIRAYIHIVLTFDKLYRHLLTGKQSLADLPSNNKSMNQGTKCDHVPSLHNYHNQIGCRNHISSSPEAMNQWGKDT
jgi:hypothetical protein